MTYIDHRQPLDPFALVIDDADDDHDEHLLEQREDAGLTRAQRVVVDFYRNKLRRRLSGESDNDTDVLQDCA